MAATAAKRKEDQASTKAQSNGVAAAVLSMPAVHIPGMRLHAVAVASTGDMVDRLGHLQALIAQLCDIECDLKEAIRSVGESEIDGRVFRATVSESVRTTLDSKAIRKDMGERWCAKYERRSLTKTVRVVARKRAS